MLEEEVCDPTKHINRTKRASFSHRSLPKISANIMEYFSLTLAEGQVLKVQFSDKRHDISWFESCISRILVADLLGSQVTTEGPSLADISNFTVFLRTTIIDLDWTARRQIEGSLLREVLTP